MIGVNINEEADQARAFLTQNRLTYPTVIDPDNRVAGIYGVELIPAVYLIDKRGILRYQGHKLPSLPEIGRAML